MKKLGLGALSLFAVSALALTLNKTPEAASPQFTTNAAFRDGLYQGKLAADEGRQFHIATARWSKSQDRASFAAGYRQSYGLISSATAAENHETR
jgi:hypothetical protein